MIENTFYAQKATSLNGEIIEMKRFRGKVVLIVNTASQCGFTHQYAGLETLYRRYKDRGLVILGFPCNQFGNQEPGDERSIAEGCLINYGVTFPMFSKVKVNGPDAHPLFTFLKRALHGVLGNRIKWNFTKFLIDADGAPIRRFAPTTRPEQMAPKIETLLKRMPR